ncbi:alpha/beta hydrolase [Streptomyces sp. Ru87]|uniref:alpha/beta hydrolase n=1 Tax=Streptomyces sp. Ru87 TaxID=2044307 RepID=UPI000BFA996A|nr:alpha/beta hydrolase [Streptomyces sp. Ru87]PGH49739.1 alpha/beta hydrolase [Streptomyces sp. Ru87]
MRSRASTTALLYRRAAVVLLAFLVAAVAGCDVISGSPGGKPGSSEAARRVERKATNRPQGLPADFTTGQRLAWSACPAPAAARSEGWECTTMKAPLDYRRPGRAAIDVAMIRKRAAGPEDKRIGSLILNFGGPGQSGLRGLPRFADDYAQLGERYDLVSFDPRGVGKTAPVRCGKKEFEGTAACKRHSGKLLPHVGTSHTARDMDLMRYLLGDEKLHYFGVSYGTMLGGLYARLFPKNVGRLVLDSPVDPTLDRIEADLPGLAALQGAFERFAAHCADTYTDCPLGTNSEQTNRRTIELLNGLEKNPAPTGGDEKLDASLAAHAIANHLDRGKQGWRPLVKALKELTQRGTGSKLMKEAYDHSPTARSRAASGTEAGSRDQSATAGDNGTSAYVAITCADSNVRLDYSQSPNLVKRAKDASPVFGEAWSLDVDICYDWPFAGEHSTPDVSADGSSPILVTGNTGDPTTPYQGAERMAHELGDRVGVLLTVRAEGHGVYPFNRCATKTVNRYLLQGAIPRHGTTCT